MNMTKSGVSSKGSLPQGASFLTRIGLGLSAALLMLAAPSVQAEDVWDGGGANSNWGTATNWVDDTAPVAGTPDSLRFAGTARLSNNNNIVGFTANGITFDAGAGTFSITGNSITNAGDIGFTGNPGTTLTQTNNLPMVFSGTRTVTTQTKGFIYLGGIISGEFGLTKAGSGTLTLAGDNTFAGPVTNSAGTLIAGNKAGALGAGELILNGGALQFLGSSNLIYNRPTTVIASSALTMNATTDATRTYTLGTLSIGAQTLTASRGANITLTRSGNVIFGSTTLTGSPTFTVNGNANVTLSAVTDGAFDYNLTKAGAGTLTLTGLGDYSGKTLIQGGVLSINSIKSVGEGGSAIGAPADTDNGTIAFGSATSGGTLAFTGSAGATTDRVIDLASTLGGAVLAIDANHTGGNLIFTSNVTATGGGDKTFQISGTSTNDNEIAGSITNGPTGNTALLKGDYGKWILSNNDSSFSGQFQINNGILQVSSIRNIGLNSALGNPLADRSGIKIGAEVNTAILKYVGTGDTTDRPINLSGTAGSPVIDQSGTGLLKFTCVTNIATGAGTKALTLQGSTEGSGEITGSITNCATAGATALAATFNAGATSIALASVDGVAVGAAISGAGGVSTTVSSVDPIARVVGLTAAATANSGALPKTMTVAGVINLTSLTKAGTGTWTLSGTNTYSGDTLVSAGTLLVNGSIASTNTTVQALATLGGSGTIMGSVSVATAGSLAPGALGVGTLTVTNNLSLDASTLVLDITNNTGNADLIVVEGTLTPSAVTTVSLNTPGALDSGEYVLIRSAHTLGGTAANFTVSSPSPAKSYSIVYVGGTNVVLMVTDNSRAVTWTGATDGNWDISTTANWSNTVTAASDVYLDGDPVTFSDFGLVQPLVSLTTNVSPLSTTVESSGTYTFGGVGGIAGAGTLTKSGSGTLVMAVSNSFSGATTIIGGTLSITHDAALGAAPGSAAAGHLTLNGGTLSVADVALSANRGLALGTSGGTIETVSGTSTYSGIADGVGLAKTGAGTLALGGENTFVGPLTVQQGTLAVPTVNNAGADGPLGNSVNAVTLGASGTTGTLEYTGATAASTKKFTVATGGSGIIQVDNSTEMLTLSGVLTGSDALTKTGPGTLNLSAANTTFTGELKVESGVLQAGGANTSCLGAGTLTLSGGELKLASDSARSYGRNTTVNGSATVTSDKAAAGAGVTYTFGTLGIGAQSLTVEAGTNAVSGTAGITFGAVTLSGASTFLVNSNGLGAATLLSLSTVTNSGFTPTFGGTGNTTVSGTVSGDGGLIKEGSGTLTFTGNSTYTGGLVIKQGAVATTGVNPNTYGTVDNIITLGDATPGNSNSASLQYQNNSTYSAVPINVVAGSSGTLSILGSTTTGATGIPGAITLANNLTIGAGAPGATTATPIFTGGITGTGNLDINYTAISGGVTFSTTPLDFSGTIVNRGTTTGETLISGGVGPNVTNITENSTASALTISGALTPNAAATTLINASGTKVLTLSGGTASAAGNLVLRNNSATANGITVSGAEVNHIGTVSNTGSGSGSVLISAAIGSAVSGVTQDSLTSSLTLSATNAYVGNTTVSAGTLAVDGQLLGAGDVTVSGVLSGSGSLSGAVTVGSGGTLAPGRDGSAGTLTVSNSTFQSGSAVKFDLTTDTAIGGGTNDLVMVNGDLAAGGTIKINALSTLSTSGDYRLFNYAGALTGSFAVEVLNSHYAATLNTSTPGQISVSFSAASAASLTWKGTALLPDWDLNASANWDSGAPSVFLTPDHVTFDGTADVNTANLVGTLLPGSVTVSGGSDVTLSGSGKIGGATGLTKSGSGVLTLATANEFTGAAAINNGTVRIGNAAALGTAAGDTTVAGGAVLDLNGQGTVAEPVKLNGTGISSGGALVNSSVTAATLSGDVTLQSASSIGGAGDLTVRGDVSGAYGLTKVGGGTSTLNTTEKTFSGNTVVEAGTLDVVSLGAGTPSVLFASPTLTIMSNAVTIVRGTGSSLGDSMDVTVEAGGLLDVQKNDVMGGLSGAGTVRQTAGGFTLTVNNGNETTEFSGTLDNPGAGPLTLTKAGTGTLTLSGRNAHTGMTTVSAGKLKITTSAALGSADAGTIVASGATLALDGSAGNLDIGAETFSLRGTGFSGALGALQNSAGNNTCGGAVTLLAGTTIGSYGGSLTLDVMSGNAISGAFNLELRGDGGTITVADPVNIGAATLTKSYSSQVTLSGGVTYGKLVQYNGVLALANIPDAPIYSGNGINTSVIRYTGSSDVLLTSGIFLGNSGGSDGNSTTIFENESAANTLALNGAITVNPTSSNKVQTLILAGSNTGNNTVGGVISNGVKGMVTLQKTGAGTWALTGENTYTGATTVTAGTLLVNNTAGSGTGSGEVSVTNATLGGIGSLGGAVTIKANSLLAPGTNTVAGGVLTCGSLTLAGGVTNTFDCTASTNDSVAVTGTLTLQGANVVALSGDALPVPAQVTIYTFGTLVGEANLSAWSVLGVPSEYSATVRKIGSSLVVVTASKGTVMQIE